jgi:large subunit ribosomal protein L21
VGPKYEQMLREMGVTTFAQIAAWSQETVDATEAKFGFKDRIEREKWVAQAKMLADGRFDEHELIYGRGKD